MTGALALGAGFTGPMDEAMQQARTQHIERAQTVDPGRCRLLGESRRTAERVEHRALAPDGTGVVVVSPLPGRSPDAVLAEADLIDRLRRRGAPALPRVRGRSREGYVREDAVPWQSRGGRRRAEVGSPHTAERRAQVSARDDLDRTVTTLHESDLVLGLTGGDGLAIRDDGTVMIRDLSRLRPSTAVRDRIADQRWIDGVLGDQGRTLRRRIDHRPPGEPADVVVRGAGDEGSDLDVADPGDRPGPRAATAWPHPLPVRALPPGERISARPSARSRRRISMTWRRYLAGAAVTCLVSAVLVMASAGLLGSASAEREQGPSASAASSSEPPAGSEAAVALEDPRALVESLVSARREHLIAGAPDTATSPGSPAAEEDSRLADAYQDVAVSGWVTRVASADVLEVDTSRGTASIRATVQESARTLVLPDGTSRTVPASPEHEVVIDVVWVEGRWLIESVRPR